MDKINIKVKDLKVMADFNRHVALEYYRGTSTSKFIAFAPGGVTRAEESTSNFLKQYDVQLESDKPMQQRVHSFLKHAKDSFLPDEAALEILVDIFLALSFGAEEVDVNDLMNIEENAYLSAEEYFDVHCRLSSIVRRDIEPTRFKTLAEAEAALFEIRAEVYTPTARQEANHASRVVSAERRLAGLSTSVRKTSSRTSEKKPARIRTAGGSSKGQGIGAFCVGHILAGKTNEQTLALALSQFPGAKTSLSSVNWYRNDLKKKGQLK